ncbi:hypothetical protein [Pedobacter antarcticus]|uniref:hypothetical protein n=1 Tax=Pedobacter antarcticus TaxID=34086 RepID=UPI0029307297|nr:hypothetical protein [Pedobacter antarcticus]
MMRIKVLLLAISILLCTISTFAQEEDQTFKTVTIGVIKDTAFDKVIDYLQAKGIFIQSVDKQAGFIQATLFLKNKNILSAKIGERRIMNFILRPLGDTTSIVLNIYSEESFTSNDSSQYYKDKGIINDPEIYREILKDLQNAFNP